MPAFSRETAVLNKIPFFAPLPLPTIIATGVANPRAQGQLITKTLIALLSEYPNGFGTINHTIKVIIAMAITVGTNTPDTLSASFAIGAFVAEASDTRLIICANVVSSPTLVALHFKNPDLLIVADVTLSSIALSTGKLSPVSTDSSIALSPSITIPSTGTLSPGLTTKTSPTATSSISTVISLPSRITFAVFGESDIKPFKASVVLPFEYASRVLPTVIKARIIAADSK